MSCDFCVAGFADTARLPAGRPRKQAAKQLLASGPVGGLPSTPREPALWVLKAILTRLLLYMKYTRSLHM